MNPENSVDVVLRLVKRLDDPSEVMQVSLKVAEYLEFLQNFYSDSHADEAHSLSIQRIGGLIKNGDALKGTDLALLACLTLADTDNFSARQVSTQLELCDREVANITSTLDLLRKRGHIGVEKEKGSHKTYSLTEGGEEYGRELVEKLVSFKFQVYSDQGEGEQRRRTKKEQREA